MTILIIEDEFRAANQLQSLLKKMPISYEVLDVIDSIEQAVFWIQNNPSPDLIFMDIQLADGLSFEIFNHVSIESPIIFTTAFDQYAIQAFKVNSIDYLLKPVQEDDLKKAIEKYQKTSAIQRIDAALITQFLNASASKKREGILVKDGNGFIHLKLSEFSYIYSEDGITLGINNTKRYIIDETIDTLFQSLAKDQFFRINRGQIIHKSAVQKIEPYFNHRVKLELKNDIGHELIVSRAKTPEFKDWMNQ